MNVTAATRDNKGAVIRKLKAEIERLSHALNQRATDDIDDQIEAAIDRVLGDSFFCPPTETATLLNVAVSTVYRAFSAGVIKTVPHGSGCAVIRPELRRLMKHGLGSFARKPVALNEKAADAQG